MAHLPPCFASCCSLNGCTADGLNLCISLQYAGLKPGSRCNYPGHPGMVHGGQVAQEVSNARVLISALPQQRRLLDEAILPLLAGVAVGACSHHVERLGYARGAEPVCSLACLAAPAA